MCPACISALAVIAAGAGSGGGLGALLVKKLRGRCRGNEPKRVTEAFGDEKEIRDEERKESRDPRSP